MFDLLSYITKCILYFWSNMYYEAVTKASIFKHATAKHNESY